MQKQKTNQNQHKPKRKQNRKRVPARLQFPSTKQEVQIKISGTSRLPDVSLPSSLSHSQGRECKGWNVDWKTVQLRAKADSARFSPLQKKMA